MRFKDRELLKTACTHRHILNEPAGRGLKNYERLEFLGDAVLGLVVSEKLYRETEGDEGFLTRQKADLVNNENTAKVAGGLGLWEHLLLSESEKHRSPNAAILSSVYEAILGAIYLDQGYPAVCGFVDRTLNIGSGHHK